MASSTVAHATVKSIVSGDTLVVKPINRSSSSKQENEQRISLSHINAPKLARPSTDNDSSGASVDEPYAFECREYLRKKLVGREISYTVDFQVPQSNRSMCSVYLGNDPESSENLIESLLSEGLVELRPQTGARANDPKYQRLLQIDQQAKSNKLGRYSNDSPTAHIRDIKWTLTDAKQFLDRHKSSPPMDAIVEFIRDGNTVRCLLLPTYQLATIQLTGVRCPIFKREGNASIEDTEPFAEEAKQFVESRLLQRQVKVIFNGTNNQNLVGTLLHPNGNIALFLLKEGLAKCVDWTLALLQPAWREQYRAAEKFAKDNRIRVWRNYTPQLVNTAEQGQTTDQSANNSSSTKGYQAKVLEIVNADALVVRDLRNNQVRKIYLSSVRAPRAVDFQSKSDGTTATSNPTLVVKRPLYDIPYIWEGRELLRKRLIGKTIRVVTDYIQKATADYPEKICCTVYSDNVNLGEALITKGLAKAIRHRQDDEQRSSCYDSLLSAEQQAMKRSLGLFSTESGVHRVIDMTGESNKERAKGLLNVFQRNGRMEGVVEFVSSGSRFRIYLLRDKYIISFLLSSVQCPRPERRVPATGNSSTEKIEQSEPFGPEALSFAKENFLQRDVVIEVESIDRGGNFIGRLTTGDGQSAALMLVQAGLAKVPDSSRNVPNNKQLLDAQEECKRQRIGIWTNYEESKEQEQENEPDNNGTENEQTNEPEVLDFNDPSFRRVMITYMTSDFKVYVQYANQGQRLEQLQSDLREIFAQTKPVGGHTPKKNELLAAQFSADNEWYRARVEKIEPNHRVSVFFVDYGNREVITTPSRLTALPAGFSQLPGQAHEYELAYVKPPPDLDDREEAKNTVLNAIGNDECLMRVEYRQNNVEHISLYRASTKENLVKVLAEQGLVIIGQGRTGRRQVRPKLLLQDLEQAQKVAKAARRGLWQYSDQIEDDATEFGFTGRK